VQAAVELLEHPAAERREVAVNARLEQ
jgi:hypothetical protein